MVRANSLPFTIPLALLLALLVLLAPRDGHGGGEAEWARAALAYKGWSTAGFRVEGLPSSLARPLVQGLALAGTPRLGGLLGRARPALTPSLLEEDLARVRLYLARHGHPSARVEVLFTPKARRRVDLLLRVDAGPAVRVAGAQVLGTLPAGVRREGLASLLPTAGDVFQDGQLQTSARRLEEALRAEGHARVRCRPGLLARDSASVDLTFLLVPGPVCMVDSIRVAGVAPDLARLARRTLSPLRGQPVTPVLLREARDRLRLLGVYGDIQLTLDGPADTLAADV